MWKRIGFWKEKINIIEYINRAEIIDGLSFVNLKDVIKWKEKAGRNKDKRDIILINQYLSRHKS